MIVALHDADATRFPNLALMKLSAWHKQRGDSVQWFAPLAGPFDLVYSSRVFTWTPLDCYLPAETQRGGIGHSLTAKLPDEVEHTCPDYALYPTAYSLGFTTRGCPRRCAWCTVPLAEGDIHAHAEIDEFTRHRELTLLDNNILAHPHGIRQLELIAQRGLRLDCNQGIDARLIDDATARLLARIRWQKYIRLACDTSAMMQIVGRAIGRLRAAGHSREIFCYVLVTEDIADALERVEYLRTLNVAPFAQPYRDRSGAYPSAESRRFARWVNHKAIFKSTPWREYQQARTAQRGLFTATTAKEQA
jgi:hypothetical protein